MKKMCLIIIWNVLLINTIYGAKVDTTTAKKVAKSFYMSRMSSGNQMPLKSISIQEVDLQLIHQEFDTSNDATGLKSEPSLPLYYVFNAAKNKGFIIISADDRVYPVLGYSFNGKYSTDNQPPAFRQWMNGYKEQIRYIIRSDLKVSPSSTIPGEWSRYSGGIMTGTDAGVSEVGPMLTTKWGQGCYYNKLCPEDYRGPCNRAWAGCFAVAMAQILKYWNEPSACQPIPGYTDPINYVSEGYEIPGSDYGPIPGVDPTVYDWAGMPDALTDQSTSDQVEEVARLIHHCGVAIKTNYGPSYSRAWVMDVRDAFDSIFNYSHAVQLILRYNFSAHGWQQIIKNELDQGRPVFYLGASNSSGHAFVCDGYKGSYEFHFNWGWTGSFHENYFYLDDITPGLDNFNEEQHAIIGIYPDYLTPDPCDEVIPISGCGAGHLQTYTGGYSGVYEMSSCGQKTPGMEQIYRFVAPGTGNYGITVTSASGYVDYFWRASSCEDADWNCIARIRNTGTYGLMNWTAGSTYYILLDDENAKTGTHQFYINCGEPVLEYYHHEIDDDNTTSLGDNDGLAEPGESVELPVTLYNSGIAAANNVTAILSTADPDITITDSDLNFGLINAGNTKQVADFDFDVSITSPVKDVLFHLDISSDEGNWSDSFYVHIYPTIDVNPCDSVMAINGCGAGNTQTFTGGANGVWIITSCSYNTPGIEQVYRFVAPASGTYSIEVTSANRYVGYFWQASGCGDSGWNCISDINSAGTYGSMNWTADSTYYILLDTENAVTGTHQFYINCGLPVIEYVSHEIDDDNVTSAGDNDGKAEPGESVEIPVTLLNSGYAAAHNVKAMLSTEDTGITITDDQVNYGKIDAGISDRVPDFDFDVSITCPEKDVLFNLDISSDEGNWSDTFYIHIYDTIEVNPCDSVIAINGCCIGNIQTYKSGSDGVWNTTGCGYYAGGSERVYRFVAATSGTYSIEVTSADGWVDYLWRASNCSESDWSCISDIHRAGRYGTMNWTADSTYYILLDAENAVTGTHQFYINCGLPVLAYHGHEIDDDNEMSSGDNDGQAEPGESINLPVTLINNGGTAANHVKAILSTTDPDITITEGDLNYGEIDAGIPKRVADFDFDVSLTCPGKDVLFSLDISADEGHWTDSFYVHIYGKVMLDPCDSVIAINGWGDDYTQRFSSGATSVWNIGNCGFQTPGFEQVYAFVAPESGEYIIHVTEASGFVDYSWQASICYESGWNCIANINSAGDYGAMNWTADTTYYILLDSENSNNGPHSFSIYYQAVGIRDKKLSDRNISIYPNPAQDFLNISILDDLEGELSITVSNVMGLRLYTGSIDKLFADEDHQLNISFLEKGVYFIRIKHEKFIKTLRFVKY